MGTRAADDFQFQPECDKVIPHGILRSDLPDEERRDGKSATCETNAGLRWNPGDASDSRCGGAGRT